MRFSQRLFALVSHSFLIFFSHHYLQSTWSWHYQIATDYPSQLEKQQWDRILSTQIQSHPHNISAAINKLLSERGYPGSVELSRDVVGSINVALNLIAFNIIVNDTYCLMQDGRYSHTPCFYHKDSVGKITLPESQLKRFDLQVDFLKPLCTLAQKQSFELTVSAYAFADYHDDKAGQYRLDVDANMTQRIEEFRQNSLYAQNKISPKAQIVLG